MTETILSFKNVSKRFGKENALKDVSINVQKGDIYGLIGRNGSGKTTIMKLITALSKETSGEISLLGAQKGQHQYSKRLERIGAVIEEPAAYAKLTAYQNMKIMCIQKGIHDFSIINELLEFVQLENTGKKKVKQFSLGMRQRLGIAMSLVNSPDFLILDEPINGLDPIAIIEFRELLEKINLERNTTIFISSHILTELYQVATRFGFIHEGEMLQEIDKKEFDLICGGSVVLKVNDIQAASVILQEQTNEEFTVVNDEEIRINKEKMPVWQLNELLVGHKVKVNEISKKEVSLENYYTTLIGKGELQ